MKKVLFAVAALATISTIPATAADMRARPVQKAPAMVAAMPAWNWSGFYIGGQVGYQWSDDDHSVTATGVPGFGTFGPFLFESDGAVYGGHAGFNWQAGQWVFGIEGDYEGSNVEGDGTFFPTGLSSTFNLEQKWQASLCGRLGWVAWDRALIYATGGVAWAKFSNSGTFDTGGATITEGSSDTVNGWTIGGGIEWAMWQNWSARIEYRYTDFDSFSFTSTNFAPAVVTTDDLTFHTVRVGLSWRFGDWGKGPMAGKGPVVGKY